MSRFKLFLHSVFYYWRTNLAVLLGVVAGTAVIGGALIVGDSVRGSLRQMTLDRLGRIDHALSGGRFFREDLAAVIADDAKFQQRFDTAAPALALTGGFSHAASEDDVHRANNVNVFGVDERFWNLVDHENPADGSTVSPPQGDEVLLSRRTAEQLRVEPGDEVTLSMELPSAVPRDSLLGDREQETRELTLTVRDVLPDAMGAARLSLKPDQQLPANAFVSLKTLQDALDLGVRRIRDPAQRRIVEKPARVNALFVAAKSEADGRGDDADEAALALSEIARETVTLDDLRLRIVENERRGYVSLESEQQILEDVWVDAGIRAAEKIGAKHSAVQVYLANEIRKAGGRKDDGEDKSKESRGFSMYSIVAGLDVPLEPPFGPFEYVGDKPSFPLDDAERDASAESDNDPPGILLNEWLAKDLDAAVGDMIELKYHVVGAHLLAEDGRLPEETVSFQVAGIVKFEGTPAEDSGLTPEVEGITDADTLGDWKQPFPMNLDRVTGRDEMYWDRYKAAPKAFVSSQTAFNLWGSKYGSKTSLRVAPPPEASLDETREKFLVALIPEVDLQSAGLMFLPVKKQGLDAASGTTDFSGLFIGFSFFLILSAMILIGLLFRLGIERRGESVGLLSAVGYTQRNVRRMYLAEGMLVVVAGGLIGLIAAVGYAKLMVYGLKTWWYGAIGTRFLEVYLTPASLATGFAISVVVAGVAVWWALRQLKGLSARQLLAGSTEQELTEAAQRGRGRKARFLGVAATIVAFGILAGVQFGAVPAGEAFEGFSWQTVAFFLVGVLLLTASLAFLSAWLDSDRAAAVRGAGVAGMGRLGLRNAARHRQRSVLTTGLIASAAFVIVAVAAGRRNPADETPVKDSGNGGFTLVAESSAPLLYDLNSSAGRNRLNVTFNQEPDVAAKIKRELIEATTIVPFRMRLGEDASCLNIYQTHLPTVLGATDRMIERGGFKFIGAEVDNPWSLLKEPHIAEKHNGIEAPTYPVVGDNNTLQYSLHKGVGDVVAVPSEDEPRYYLKIVGRFDGSVFQGVLLMSEENFLKLYPEQTGYRYFLLDTPATLGDATNAAVQARLMEVNGRTEELKAEVKTAIDAEDEEAIDRLKAELNDLTNELTALKAIVAGTPSEQVAGILETKLSPYGFDAERVADRLADFLAVQNTYLSTFQTLGGLGLLLGTLGLATVMLRNVLERRPELALLRAVGFRNGGLAWLVLWENAFLLLWGLTAGTVSALLAMTPHLLTTGADFPVWSTAAILTGVFVVGMAAALLAVWEAVRTPILATLRAE